jgi:hypothetical protein
MNSVRKLILVDVSVLLSAAMVTILLGIVPFFAYRLYLENPAQVAGGMFDPKNYPLFDYHTALGNVTHALALSALATIPLWAVPLSAVLAFTLLRSAMHVRGRLRLAVVAAILIGVGLSLFYFTPFARLLLTWHVD